MDKQDKWATAGLAAFCLPLLAPVFVAVHAFAHDVNVYAVHYKSASDEEAKEEFQKRDYRVVGGVQRVDPSINCEEARDAVRTAAGKAGGGCFEYEGALDVTLGQDCAIWKFKGDYLGPTTADPKVLGREGRGGYCREHNH